MARGGLIVAVAEVRGSPDRAFQAFVTDGHPFLGERETSITYRFEPTAYGTLVTVRDEGFVGRAAAAQGNGEMWEKVLGLLETYLETESRRAE